MPNKRHRSKTSPNTSEQNKRSNMASSVFTSPTGPGLSPMSQGQSFIMPPTFNYVPQYPGMSSGTMSQQPPNMFQNQQNSDFMAQIIQKLDSMDKKLGQLDSIQSAVNSITTRMSSVEQKVTSLEAKVTEIEKSRNFDSTSLDEIRKRQTEMDRILSKIQKTQEERSKNETRVQSSLNEMKCLEMKNNLLFFKVAEEAVEADREIEQCIPKVQRIMEESMDIENARHKVKIKQAYRLGKFNAAKTRPILVEFQTFEGREAVRKASPNLKDTDYGVSQQYTREVVLKRRKLLPVLKTARSEKKKAFLSFDKLYINGELYMGPEA